MIKIDPHLDFSMYKYFHFVSEAILDNVDDDSFENEAEVYGTPAMVCLFMDVFNFHIIANLYCIRFTSYQIYIISDLCHFNI